MRVVPRGLVEKVGGHTTNDGTPQESLEAQVPGVPVRLLEKCGPPPALAVGAVASVLSRAEAMGEGWVG